MRIVVFIFLLFEILKPEVYFKEEFLGNWRSRWVQSLNKAEKERGVVNVESPKKTYNKERTKGLKTLNDSKFYQYSADIGKTVDFTNKTFVFSYTVLHEKENECGGYYLKVLPDTLNQSDFGGHSPFFLMFGPDMCGRNSDKMQFVIKRNNTEYQSHNPPKCSKDQKTHLYTVIIYANLSYEITIDDKSHRKGKMWDDFSFIQNPTIADPNAKKPDEWDERKEIPDPKFPKPDDWDQPMTIIDTTAKKPKNWNEQLRGPWKQPEIPNPDYKGEWWPKLIKNQGYMGEWKRPRIPNPKFVAGRSQYYFRNVRYIGIDVWQVNAGVYFDNIFLGDNVNEYKAFKMVNWEPIAKYEAGIKSSSSKSSGKGKYDEHGNYFSDGNSDVIFGKNKPNMGSKKKKVEDDDDDDEDDEPDL